MSVKVEKAEAPVIITLSSRTAMELKTLLMCEITWDEAEFGRTAEAIYNALTDAGVLEA